jgi:hypothetical protein
VLVGPFNCPIESPVLLLGGALMEGGHATLEYASNTSVVMDIVEFKARLGPGTTPPQLQRGGGMKVCA